jgi:hypothetical protein
MTGEELYQEIEAAALKARVSITRFAAPVFPCAYKVEQLRLAKNVRQSTIERVRALTAGDPVPPPSGKYIRDPRAIGLSRAEAEALGVEPSLRSINERAALERQSQARIQLDLDRQIADLARETRRPGQTVADRARELRKEVTS